MDSEFKNLQELSKEWATKTNRGSSEIYAFLSGIQTALESCKVKNAYEITNKIEDVLDEIYRKNDEL